MPEKSRSSHPRSPEFALLGFLIEAPTHGYILHRQLETELGQVWHISQSQTYAILKRLEAQGDISSRHLEQEKLPPRQLLQITPSGRRRFQSWLRHPSGSSVRSIRLEFITRLYFARKLYPGRVQSIIAAQTAEVKADLERLHGILASVPPEQAFNRLGLELRIRQLYSISDWLGECRQSLGVLE